MPEINKNCLFHMDRLKFDQMEKELKQSKWIPRNNCHRLASAICSCRKHTAEWQSDHEELADHTRCFRAILDGEEQELSSYLSAFITSILDSVTPTDFSRCRLLKILFLAQNGDFSLLSRSAICNNSDNSVDVKQTQPKPHKLSQKQYDCMIRKKKKKLDSEVVGLPMFPGNIKKLETKLGSNLENYSKKERFIYEMKHVLNNRNFNNNVNMTYIEIWSQNKDSINSVKTCLRQKAMEAQQLAVYQKEKRKAIKEQRRACYLSYLDEDRSDNEENLYDAGIIQKSRLEDVFTSKLRQDKHTGRRQVKPSVLIGGHCFHCFKPFAGLKKKTIPKCVYHPGFIKRGQWSCCFQDVENRLDLEKEHETTGRDTYVEASQESQQKTEEGYSTQDTNINVTHIT